MSRKRWFGETGYEATRDAYGILPGGVLESDAVNLPFRLDPSQIKAGDILVATGWGTAQIVVVDHESFLAAYLSQLGDA